MEFRSGKRNIARIIFAQLRNVWKLRYDRGSLNHHTEFFYMTIEQLLADVAAALRENTAALKANAGAALVSTPAAGDGDKVKKVTYFNMVNEKRVVKVEAGGERPVGGVELPAAEAKKLDERYKADAAKNDQTSQTGAAAGQTPATGASSGSTASQSGSQSSDGPSFEDVTVKITALSKLPEVGRAKVVELLKKWGVEKFPQAQGKKSNAELIADIEAATKPPAPAEDGGLDDLGL